MKVNRRAKLPILINKEKPTRKNTNKNPHTNKMQYLKTEGRYDQQNDGNIEVIF